MPWLLPQPADHTLSACFRYDKALSITSNRQSIILTWSFLRKCESLLNYLSRGIVDNSLQPPQCCLPANIFHSAHLTAVFPDSFFADEPTDISHALLSASQYAADAFDRVTSAIRDKAPLFLDDLLRLYDAEMAHRAAFDDWKREDNQLLIAKSKYALEQFYPSMNNVPYEVVVSEAPHIESLAASSSRLIHSVYSVATSVRDVIYLIQFARDQYIAKRAAELAQPQLVRRADLGAGASLDFLLSKSNFTIDAIIDRATPSIITDGIFHLELGLGDSDPALPQTGTPDFDTLLKTVAGGVLTCYANTTVPAAPDMFSVMVLMNLVRILKKHPSLMAWTREFYEEIQNVHLKEIREYRGHPSAARSEMVLDAAVGPCPSPRDD